MQYRISPIRKDFLVKVRDSNIDDQNNPVVNRVAIGGEPCRDVLRAAVAGEKIILASYCPFSKPGPYKEYGPIFVLAKQSDEIVSYEKIPLPDNSESSYFGDIFVLKAYTKDEYIYDARLVTPLNAEQTVSEFLLHKEVEFIIARYAAYGCYSLRLDRP
jgi:hypothetical protein